MNSYIKKAFFGLCLVTVVLSLGFVSLYINESDLLSEVSSSLSGTKDAKSISTLVLNGKTTDKELSKHLLDKRVYQDPKDAECISKWITSRIGKTLPNLGALNKNQFRMPADSVFGKPISEVAGEKVLQAIETSKLKLGLSQDVRKLYYEIGKETLNPAQLISFPTDSASYRQATAQVVGDTLFTKVSIQVLKTKESVDTLTVRSKAFRYNALCRIPYVGSRVADKLLNGMRQSRKNQEGVPNVLIRVKEHTRDKAGADLGYLLTDSYGQAIVFLPSDGYYSFLPVREGFEYGSSKGTRRGVLGNEDVEYTFHQKRHTIKPIDTQTYLRIKEDCILAVRSPKEYKNTLLLYPCIFFIAWWLLFFFFVLYDLKKKTQTDYIIPLALMVLSGIGLLSMFSIVNPLTDTLLGSTMAFGAVFGIIVLALISCVDWGLFYVVGIRGKKGVVQFDFVLQLIRWIYLPFMEKVQSFKIGRKASTGDIIGYYLMLLVSVLFIPMELLFRLFSWFAKSLDGIIKKVTISVVKKPSERIKHWARMPFNGTLPKGFGYVIIVLFFILLLQLFGDGPEGSGTKVNLLFFQPSELNKYLIVIFMASFFSIRAERITMFSDVLDTFHFRLQLKTVFLILISLITLLGLYMVVMSDMGPALVLIVTFVFLYAIARKDFKQMLIGIATFIGMIWLGGTINDNSLFTKFFFAVVWYAGWRIFWWVKEKRLYESAIFFNILLSAFIFIGPWLATTNSDRFRSVGQRIVDRNEVAMHLWDNSVRGGGDQVVQGIWSLSTGGFSGQGLGLGNPNLVPAFHTDMIFTSIGEEMGWISLLLIILCLAIIIHRSLVIAYKSGDRFLFFLTSGIAIVTGVQFFVIILGAIGIIPLTGVAVPFLSFGMTSLIINLAIFGVVISVSRNNATQNQREINRPYRYVTAVGIGSFLAVSVVLVALLFQYQVLPTTRNKYLVKPAFVSNNEGHRLAEYNPRIRLLLKEMKAGNIKDRNGLLLATSDKETYSNFINYEKKAIVAKIKQEKKKEKTDTTFDTALFNALQGSDEYLSKERYQVHSRYYPFREHMFFILGDFNTQTLWGINERNPYGYLAEERLLGELRGFTTAVVDDNNQPVSVELRSSQYYYSPFANPSDTSFTYNLRNYKPLLRYLRDGIHGQRVKSYNADTENGKRDVYLTVDARLQTFLQQKMAEYLNNPKKCEKYNTKSRPKLRASVVVLDACKGDVLTSSNYPLPNQDSIRKYQDLRIDYSKYERVWSNPVITDRDLGSTYQTNPGSTAKIMSSIAGLMKEGIGITNQEYNINSAERIHDESGTEPTGDVSMQKAIVKSSNCYFINLVNDKDLYPQLETLYGYVGARVSSPTYFLFENEIAETVLRTRKESIHDEVLFMEEHAITDYKQYLEDRARKNYKKMRNQYWQWPWGQGTLDASPLTMARVASIVYNGGVLPETHWIYAYGKAKSLDYYKPSEIRIINKDESNSLMQFMKDEASSHKGLPKSMGGKTGTPSREIKFSYRRDAISVNDGWYMCFVDAKIKDSGQMTPLAIAVRLERVGINRNKERGGGSGDALDFVRNVVVPSLKESGYITETE